MEPPYNFNVSCASQSGKMGMGTKLPVKVSTTNNARPRQAFFRLLLHHLSYVNPRRRDGSVRFDIWVVAFRTEVGRNISLYT